MRHLADAGQVRPMRSVGARWQQVLRPVWQDLLTNLNAPPQSTSIFAGLLARGRDLIWNVIHHVMLTTFSSRHLVGVWYLFAASLVGLDQATKYAVQVLMPLRTSIEVTPFFNLVHVLNPGAAFSFLADAGGWQRYLFTGLGTAVSVFLAFALWRGVRSRLETAAYVGMMGGALGNVIDRLRIGAVVDYLDFHWLGWHWPAFNLADMFVVGGVALLLLAGVMEPRVIEIKQHPNKESKS